MAMWYIKELSKLTKVSVRTLHHYDTLGLLKPSERLPNGYRVYSENDVFKLQHIVALKSFGFKLSTIGTILKGQSSLVDQLKMQQSMVKQQLASLQEADQLLTKILQTTKSNTSVDSVTIFNLIELYFTTKKLEKTWAGTVFSTEQLDEFITMGKNIPLQEQVEYSHRWDKLIAKVQKHLDEDPKSSIGKQLSTEWMDLVNEWYGNKQELKNVIWQAFKQGKIPAKDQELGFPAITPEMTSWIDVAVQAHQKKKTDK